MLVSSRVYGQMLAHGQFMPFDNGCVVAASYFDKCVLGLDQEYPTRAYSAIR